MKVQATQPQFNKEWALKKGKKEFVSHFKDIYPLLNLEEEFDKIAGKLPDIIEEAELNKIEDNLKKLKKKSN